MSHSFGLLSEGMPGARGLSKTTFPADARKTKSWVAALPRANAIATQQSLAQALDSLNGQRLEGVLRLAVLEELRPAIGESIGLLKREYAGSGLPLAANKAVAARQVEEFHLVMANGYRKAVVEICAPAGNIPMLRGNNVAMALARAAWHYSQALAVSWRIYRAPSAGNWQGLHRIHHFAAEHKLERKQIEDRLAGSAVEVHAQYLQTLLMAVTHPLAFSQLEQDTLWQVTAEFAPRCVLLRDAPPANAPVVAEDADRGPGPGAVGETHAQWLEIVPFRSEVDAALTRQREGFSELIPGRGHGIRVSVEFLQRLLRSFGQAAARTHKRLTASHNMRAVFGLSSLHFHLAGQRDFESFMRHATQHIVHLADRSSWAAASTDASRVPVHETRVLDQSLGGYRVAWDQAQQIRARVGELVGLTFAGPDEIPEWMLGVLRWLRYSDDGGLSAGIELVSRRTAAVGLRVRGKRGAIEEPIRAIEIEAPEGDDTMIFLAPSGLDGGATQIEVVRDEAEVQMSGASNIEQVLAGVEVLQNAGDYALLRPLRADLISEPDARASR